MASTMAANTTSAHNVSDESCIQSSTHIDGQQVRSGRGSNMSSSGMSGDRTRGSHGNGMGKGFGAGKTSWNSNIWGDTNLSGGFGDGM